MSFTISSLTVDFQSTFLLNAPCLLNILGSVFLKNNDKCYYDEQSVLIL